MSMKIGQVARLLDLPVETIRFYEKNEIITPKRRDNSTYREYEAWDIFDLFECMGYRGLGFSVKEVKRIMKDASLEDINAMLDQKISQIREQERILEHQIRELKELRQEIRTVRYNIGRYWVEYSPRRLYAHSVYNVEGQYEDFESDNEILRKWVGKVPFTKAGVLIDPQKVCEERSIIEWIQAIKEENLTYADLTMEDVEGCCMEERMCLTTIIDMGERGYFSPEMLIPVVTYAGQSGYKITGKYYGEIFLRNYEKQGWR